VRQPNAWIVHAAEIQDRDGGVLLMSTLFGLFPFLLKLYADSGYQGPQYGQVSCSPSVSANWRTVMGPLLTPNLDEVLIHR
jgi:hypothetical protein